MLLHVELVALKKQRCDYRVSAFKVCRGQVRKARSQLGEENGDIAGFLEKVSFYNEVNVGYLKETTRWSYIVKNASANDIAVILAQVMSDIEDSNAP